MFLKIKPQDTLFFRTGRPFSMGAETWADYVFPPNPSTFYGAIRTFLIFQRSDLCKFLNNKISKNDFEDIGTKKEKGTLKIYGPFLYDETSISILFPTPADLVRVKENKKEDEKLVRVSFQEKPKVIYSDYPLEMSLIFKGNKKVEETTGFIDEITLKEYLEGKKGKFSFLKIKEIFEEELKIGIKRDRFTKSSEEAHLYRVPMLRLKENISFLLKLEEVKKFPEKGIFQLGAEGKTINFEVFNENPLEELKSLKFELKDGLFKLYLVTPAIFEKGWIPKWMDESNLEGEFNGIHVKLVAVALKKHKLVGGWNLAENKPKPMYKVVPEGSVYYLRVLNEVDETKVKEVFHLRTISDINPEEGFGLVMVGEVL